MNIYILYFPKKQDPVNVSSCSFKILQHKISAFIYQRLKEIPLGLLLVNHSNTIKIIIKRMMQVCMPSKKYPDTNIQLSVLMHGGSKTACVLSVCHENKSRGFDNKYSFVNKAYFRQSSSGKHFIWLPNKHSETN